MRKSQENFDDNIKNNEEFGENNYYGGGPKKKIKKPPMYLPFFIILILLAAIYLEINYLFFSPEKSVGGKLPKNEYIKFMTPPAKPEAVTPNPDEGNPAENQENTAGSAELKDEN